MIIESVSVHLKQNQHFGLHVFVDLNVEAGPAITAELRISQALGARDFVN